MSSMNRAVESRIPEIRGQRVILDRDLAEVYGVTTARLNQQLKRNQAKFPGDFAFLLTRQELAHLMSQIVTSSSGYGGVRKLPWAFTEHGAIMAASILNSPKAVEMSVFVVRAFVELRRQFSIRDELARRLDHIERKLMRHDASLQEIYREIKALRQDAASPSRRQIGFKPGE
jgi:hypothetical protein